MPTSRPSSTSRHRRCGAPTDNPCLREGGDSALLVHCDRGLEFEGLKPPRVPAADTMRLLALVILLFGIGCYVTKRGISEHTDVISAGGNRTVFHFPTSIRRGDFAQTFTTLLLADEIDANFMAPFILKGGVLMCRRAHIDQLASSSTRVRYRSFVDMLNTAKHLGLRGLLPATAVPILFVPDDNNFCNITKREESREDSFGFPRLTMSTISDKHATQLLPSPLAYQDANDEARHASDWCSAVAIPTYEVWEWVTNKGWKRWKFRRYYPWGKKVRKAVWRGTTTAHSWQYGGFTLNETPRGKVVRAGMNRPDLIDAAFVKLVQDYSDHEKWANTTRLSSERIPFDDQMLYLAIIDVDGKSAPMITVPTRIIEQLHHDTDSWNQGNGWSSRFPKLLCMNSVTIKIEPDFIEYFHHDLIPGRHYIPASLGNLTQVVDYVVSPANDDEMKNVVREANAWCQQAMVVESVARSAMEQISEYYDELTATIDESSIAIEDVGDLVPIRQLRLH